MRPIDADALKAKFCNHCDERDCKPDATDTVYGCVIADTIDSMPTIEAEPDNGWISAKDKLPDEGENVLIYCPEFLEDIRKAFYTEGDFFVEKEDLIVRPAPNGYCTHWRHLPKPPKGE